MAITTRTQCLISPSNFTAFTSPISKSASSSTRKRTRIPLSSTSGRRMTLFTLIYISLAAITLFLSPSACADNVESCTPQFISLDDDREEEGPDFFKSFDDDPWKQNAVFVREGTSFNLSCVLSQSHVVKWTKDNKLITPQDQNKWNMVLIEENPMDSFIYTELLVYNASTQFHTGEYKCTSICLDGPNHGVKVTVSFEIHLELNTNTTGGQKSTKSAAREKRVELICTAYVPEALMSWSRRVNGGTWQNMNEVCDIPDVELSDRKKPPDHCKLITENREAMTILKLEIKRVRKEGNASIPTLSDFREYKCDASQDSYQGNSKTVELIERVSITRSFGHRGVQSLTVVQGDELQIYCDIHGVKEADFKGHAAGRGEHIIVWKKDGKEISNEDGTFPDPKAKSFEKQATDEKGKPFRFGFKYDMAEPEHRGLYTCELRKSRNRTGEPIDTLTYYVRVKDKLGALWPFLGICGEVVLLCTIILIYEKRKSKAELEETDTDGSPDQANSNSND